MRSLAKFDNRYFMKFKDKPVKTKPYDPKQKEIGERRSKGLRKLFKDFDVNYAYALIIHVSYNTRNYGF